MYANIAEIGYSDETFDKTALAFTGEYPLRSGKAIAQNGTLKFNTSFPGYLVVKFSDTGTSASATAVKRYLIVNGETTEYWASRAKAGDGAYDAQLNVTTGAIVVPAGDVTISGTSALVYSKVEFTPITSVPATIGDAGYASFSSTYALDFSGVAGLEVYIATSGSETTVSMEKVDDAAAGTGLVLKGAAGTYNIPVVASATDHSATNRLWAITSDGSVTAAGTGWTNYVLAKQNGNVVFAPVTGENSVAVTAGHAALCLANPSGARAVSMVFDGEATGIENLTPALSEGEGAFYDLQGRRVAQPTKGLYIVNGKKVMIK